MTFYDIRLPEGIEKGSRGGPRFLTIVGEKVSGHEQRNRRWARTRGRWNVGYGISDAADMDQVLSLFYVVEGQLIGWRFKHWADFNIGTPGLGGAGAGYVGVGDGANKVFQANRRYSFGGFTYDRPVFKLVSGTVRAFVNEATELTLVGGAPGAGQFAVDLNTGLLTTGDTLGGPGSGGNGPLGEDELTMLAEFDCAVRWATDDFDVESFWLDAHEIPQLFIREIRDIA